MRRLLVAFAAVLLCAPGAQAKGALGCVVVKDVTGDAELVAGNVRNARPDETHVDVRGASLFVREGRVSAVVYLEDLAAERGGTWKVSFTSRGKMAYFLADVPAAPAGPAAATWVAGVAGHDAVPAWGRLDSTNMDSVAMSAPASAFGVAAPRDGDVITGFAVTSTERLVRDGLPKGRGVEITDAAAGDGRYVAGRHCNDRFP